MYLYQNSRIKKPFFIDYIVVQTNEETLQFPKPPNLFCVQYPKQWNKERNKETLQFPHHGFWGVKYAEGTTPVPQPPG
jgi:hypothetical protein